jgi:hypothetical protein
MVRAGPPRRSISTGRPPDATDTPRWSAIEAAGASPIGGLGGPEEPRAISYLDHPVYYPIAALTFLTAAAVALRRPVHRAWAWVAAILGVSTSLALIDLKHGVPYDFKLFWCCGRDLWAGVDEYALDPRGPRQLVLNPPTALPLFAAFACLPLRDGARLWTALNVLAGIALVPLARRALGAQLGPGAPALPRERSCPAPRTAASCWASSPP